MQLPAKNSLNIPTYLDFARVHNNSTSVKAAHGLSDGPFLHWHRWFLYKYEQALQIVSGSCVTLPYWDWTKDAGNEYNATVLQPDSFGSTTGINTTDNCVIEGIASKNGFWNKTAKGGCLKRYASRLCDVVLLVAGSHYLPFLLGPSVRDLQTIRPRMLLFG